MHNRQARLAILRISISALILALVISGCSDGYDSGVPQGAEKELIAPLEGGADALPLGAKVPSPAVADALPAKPKGPSPTPAVDPNLLLPDLRTIEAGDLKIRYAAGQRQIRFSTTIENVGDGPMQLVGELDPRTISATASQIIERNAGGPLPRLIGKMQYDQRHGHWHLNNFAIFELWTYGPGGRLETMITSTPKITFCLIDMFRVDPAATYGADNPKFTRCNWREQGISVGWSEVYTSDLPGQELNIGNLPDGNYALRTILDPLGQLMEKDILNNSSTVFVQIIGASISQLPSP